MRNTYIAVVGREPFVRQGRLSDMPELVIRGNTYDMQLSV